QKPASPSPFKDDSDEEIRIRVSYTREQKLAAITYAITFTKPDKNGVMKLIIKYEAAKKLKITPTMLNKWIKGRKDVKNLNKGKRKNRQHITAQESAMEDSLYQQFLKR
ncbi:hypothetical protein MMC12_002456, partial [Toensbergia leucococca]|nr:hypothetical protein [Toensbergia leucococca]